MMVKLVKDCYTGFGILPKGMKGTVIGERKGLIVKVGETTTQKDEYLVMFRNVVIHGGGVPHDERFWVKKDAVKKPAPWDYLF